MRRTAVYPDAATCDEHNGLSLEASQSAVPATDSDALAGELHPLRTTGVAQPLSILPSALHRAALLRLHQIIAPDGLVNVSGSRWYSGIAAGDFPAPVKIGRSSFWVAGDILDLLERIRAGGFDPDHVSNDDRREQVGRNDEPHPRTIFGSTETAAAAARTKARQGNRLVRP